MRQEIRTSPPKLAQLRSMKSPTRFPRWTPTSGFAAEHEDMPSGIIHIEGPRRGAFSASCFDLCHRRKRRLLMKGKGFCAQDVLDFIIRSPQGTRL
eukprot:scaffold258030_cov28-Tisochrysis_lutea.AAC.3